MSGSSAVGSGRLGGRVVWLVVVVAAWLLVVGGGSAWATTGHAFVGQFGGYGNGDGQFAEPGAVGPAGVAVMPSTGEVFTADEAQGFSGPGGIAPRVQRFSADGTFLSSFALDRSYEGGTTGLAVDPGGSGAVYVATGANGGVPSVVKYSLAGVKAYALDVGLSGVSINPGARVAVDPADRTVYVTATDVNGLSVVASFDGSTGGFVGAFDGSSSPSGGFVCAPSSLAVDGSGGVYVLDPCTSRVDQYSAGAYVRNVYGESFPLPGLPIPEPFAVAADPDSDEVYVAARGPPSVGVQVTHFSAGGVSPLYTFDVREVLGVRAMAVSGAGAVYISDIVRPFVARFTRFDGPTVVTGAASSVEARSAVLEGTIDPEGVDSSYYFEYSTDLSYGSRTRPDTDAGSGNGAVAASAVVSDLRPNTTYNIRLVGSNASGSIVASAGSLRTGPAPPDVDGSPAFASAITPRSARLHGTVNPNNNEVTTYFLEYGTTTAYGRTADTTGSDSGPACFSTCGGVNRPVVGLASGLEPGTTYHFRVVAWDSGNSGPLQFGEDQTFTTSPAAGGGATGVTTTRATLTGTVDPHGVATSYYFNYGPTASYGASTSEVDAGSGGGDQLVSQRVSGLLPDTTYHVQVVATDVDGVERSGADGVFRTAPAPRAVVIGPGGVSMDSAVLAGEVNTLGLSGSYHFDVWSLDSGFVRSTPERPVAGSDGIERVGAVMGGLPAGERFVVQLTVSSNDSVGVSDMLTFATAAVPRVLAVAPATAYGCGSPRLDAVGGRPKPGELVSVTGRDLGVGGSVVLGDRVVKAVGWSASGFKVVVPDDAVGALALTVNCGRRSNTVAVAVFQEPDSRFSITGRSVVGSVASLRVRVPGPGKLESSGVNTRAAKVTVKRAGTATVKVRLSGAGVRALGRASSRSLKVRVRVRFTPAGGRSAAKTVTVTFKRGSRR